MISSTFQQLSHPNDASDTMVKCSNMKCVLVLMTMLMLAFVLLVIVIGNNLNERVKTKCFHSNTKRDIRWNGILL